MNKHTLDEFKIIATQALASKETPNKKQEEWRHSDLKLLEICNDEIKAIGQKMLISPSEEYYSLFLVNKKLDKNKSVLPKTGIKIYGVNDKEFIDELFKLNLEKGFDNKYQVLQNYSKMTSGILINISQTLDRPLKICYSSHASYHVTFVKIDKGISVKFYEEFIQYENGFTNQVTKIKLGENSNCKHFKQHNFGSNANFIYSSEITCKKHSQYDNYVVNIECKSYRQDIGCKLQGEKASGNFYGIVIGKKQEIYDMILKIDHQSSYTSSIQHYNQVFADKSRGSFIGNTKIPKFLNGIEAHQLNKNLLLGEKARAFSKPELDIHSDDVACSHGATVGNLDEDAMYYLKSRGIDKQIAEKLIVQGFLKSVFEDKELDKRDYKKLTYQIADSISL